jgi:hypothetical protein
MKTPAEINAELDSLLNPAYPPRLVIEAAFTLGMCIGLDLHDKPYQEMQDICKLLNDFRDKEVN